MKEYCFSPVLKTARDYSAAKDLTKEPDKKTQKSKKTLRQLNDFSIPVFPKIVQQLKHFFIREHLSSVPLWESFRLSCPFDILHAQACTPRAGLVCTILIFIPLVMCPFQRISPKLLSWVCSTSEMDAVSLQSQRN